MTFAYSVMDFLDLRGKARFWIFRRTQGLNDGLLLPDDIAGIRSIYGSGHGSVTPIAIPEPATWIAALISCTSSMTAANGVRRAPN